MLFVYIDPLIFFIALGVGIFIAYVLNPTPKIVHKYPTPESSEDITYVDDESVCYKYKSEEVTPPENLSNVHTLE